MTLLIVGFLSISLVTFGLVIAMTRSSPADKSIAHRMALIQPLARNGTLLAPDTAHWFKNSGGGGLSGIDELLQRFQIAQRLQRRIKQADSSTTVSTLILRSLGLGVVGYVIALLFAPVPLLDAVCAIGLATLPYGIISFQRSRRINAFNAVLAESIDMLARALRAGYSMVGAIEMLSENAQQPAADEFGELFKQQNLGLPLRDALMQLLDRVPSLDLRVLVTAILVQKDTGGNLAEILDRTVFVIRERLRIQGEIRVHTAQGRLTGWILSALPVVMLGLINMLNPGYSAILLNDPLGHKLIYTCIGLLTVGTLIIRQIINGIEV